MDIEQKTDLQLANERLSDLKPNVTRKDIDESPWAEPTIKRYLIGGGKKLDVAAAMLTYFRGRIEDRRSLILQEV